MAAINSPTWRRWKTRPPAAESRQHAGALGGPLSPLGGPNFQGRVWRQQVLLLAIVLVAFALLQCGLRLSTTIQVGADEGFELAKATLRLHGYELYSEVWNDQPPLHTFLVVQVLKHISPSILGPRVVTSFSAVALLGSVFVLGLRLGGPLAATAGAVLLLAAPGFLELSSSCMLELPALAPAAAALGLLLQCQRGKHAAVEVVSGLLFGMALLLKPVPAMLLPLAALALWVRPRGDDAALNFAQLPQPPIGGPSARLDDPGRDFVSSLLRFGASAVLAFLALEALVDGGTYLFHLEQSWSSHFGGVRSLEYGAPADHSFVWSILLKNWDLTIPAAVGLRACLTGRRENPALLVPAAWLALVLAVFARHRPWWPYYYVHLAVPLCCCAAIGIASAWRCLRRRVSAALCLAVGLYTVCAICWMGARLYLQAAEIRRSPQTYNSLLLKEIARLRPFVRFLYTDEPVYSFHAGIPMPPNLAVLPLKRFWSGDMTNARLAAELRERGPEVILLRNSGAETPFQELLESGYRMIYQDADHLLYAGRTVAKAAGY